MTLADDQWMAFVGEVNEVIWLDAVAPGLIAKLVQEASQRPRTPENPDPTFFVGHGDPNRPDSIPIGALRLSQLQQLCEGLAGDTRAAEIFTYQAIVFAYSLWNDKYRPQLAAALGVPLKEVSSDEWGDIRRLRHDIVHHNGVATAEWSGRCVLPAVQAVVTVGEPLPLTARWFAQLVGSAKVTASPPPTSPGNGPGSGPTG